MLSFWHGSSICIKFGSEVSEVCKKEKSQRRFVTFNVDEQLIHYQHPNEEARCNLFHHCWSKAAYWIIQWITLESSKMGHHSQYLVKYIDNFPNLTWFYLKTENLLKNSLNARSQLQNMSECQKIRNLELFLQLKEFFLSHRCICSPKGFSALMENSLLPHYSYYSWCLLENVMNGTNNSKNHLKINCWYGFIDANFTNYYLLHNFTKPGYVFP